MSVVLQSPTTISGLVIPDRVIDFQSFVRWSESADFPDTGRFSFINGNVWTDINMEQLFTHGSLKTEIAAVLVSLVKTLALGYVFCDRTRLNCNQADLSVEPDVLFLSLDAIRTGRAKLVQGAEDGFTSIDGAVDAIVEIVSAASVRKDTVELRDAYFEAGISEYWLIDARREVLSFDLLKRGSTGFVAEQPQAGGWLKSTVFEKSFRITQYLDLLSHPQFTLEHRD